MVVVKKDQKRDLALSLLWVVVVKEVVMDRERDVYKNVLEESRSFHRMIATPFVDWSPPLIEWSPPPVEW